MSRCFPYPPPGYVKNGIRDEALIESIKIKREEEKAKKERKKEKKEKKEKKREKKERDKSRDSGEAESKKHGHKKRHKDERSKEDQKGGDRQKKREYEVEYFEKSTLTEEHGQAVGPQNSSDSTLNSSKRQKLSLPPDSGQNPGSIIRIRLPFQRHKDPEVLPSKEQPCSTSGNTDEAFVQRVREHAPRPGKELEEQPCSTSDIKRPELTFKLGKEKACSSSRTSETLAHNTKAPTLSNLCTTCPPKLALQFKNLVEDWVMPTLQSELTSSGDDWLFQKKQNLNTEVKTHKDGNLNSNQMSSAQPQMMNQSHQLMASAAHSQAMNQLAASQSQPINSGPLMMTQPPPPMMLNRSYKPWQSQDPNQNPNPNKKFSSFNRNNNWKGKKVSFGKDSWKFENKPLPMGSVSAISSVPAASGSNTQGYKPPTLNELQNQNRLKARKFYGNKKKFNNSNNRFAPYAPRNTTSFIIRAKKSGGIASLVSPCPVTPAVLPTPIFSPSREVLGDMAKEEWGVDGYGSMKGLIRLRSPEAGHDDEEDDDGGNGGGSSDSDVEEHVEVERRLDHDLSRFEMIYPSYGGDYNNVLENRVDDQDTHIAQLEEENLTLKERLFLMERELGDLRRRLQFLERRSQIVEDVNEEVVENGSDNESEGGGSDVRVVTSAAANDNVEIVGFATGNTRNVDVVMEENNIGGMPRNEVLMDVFMDEIARGNELNNEGRVDVELKPQDVSEEIIRDKENEAKGEEAGGSEFVEEKIVEEDKDLSRYKETSNEAADNTETKNEEVHL